MRTDWVVDVEIKTKKWPKAIRKQMDKAQGIPDYMNNPLITSDAGRRWLCYVLPVAGPLESPRTAAGLAMQVVEKMGFQVIGIKMEQIKA